MLVMKKQVVGSNMKQKKEIKLIIFDLWQTLVYRETSLSYHKRIIKLFNLKINEKKFIKIFENSVQKRKWKSKYMAYENLCKNLKLPITKKNVNILMDLRDKTEERTKEYVHTIPMLKKLKKQKYKIALLSNSSVFAIKQVKEKTKILKYIDFPMFSFQYGNIKPSLRGFKLLFKKTKFKPNETIMIGDKMGDDVLPERKIRIRAIHFKNYSQLKKDLKKLGISI